MTGYQAKAGRWLVVLGAKFVWVVPFRTSLVVLLTLFSQIAHLLAFFLPLKIVILLGSDGIPRYFPPSFANFDRDLLVIILGFATVGFFAAHAIAERVIDWVTKGAAHLLVERNKKLVLFENQDQVAEGSYQAFARALAGLIFCLIALTALAWIYPEMAMVMGGYLALVTTLILGAVARSDNARNWVNANLSKLLGNLSAMGFFCVFGYLVVDFVLLDPPGILMAILSILAGRQSFGRVAAAVGGLYRLYGQRDKLDAMFFHGRPLLSVVADKPGPFWECLAPGKRGEWVIPLLQEFCSSEALDREEIDKSLKWQKPAIPNVGALTYSNGDFVWMMKLFSQKNRGASRHEATLLADAPRGLPAPDFHGTSQFDSFPCAVYRLELGKVVARKRHRSARIQVFSKLLLLEPPRPLVRRYLRSMSTLPQRMNAAWLDRLAIAVSTSRHYSALEGLQQRWQELQNLLSALPLVIYNPSLKPGLIWQAELSGELSVLHWERWSLEPAGAGWPVAGKALKQLTDCHQEAVNNGHSLSGYASEHLVLAALTFELEQQVKNQRLDMGADTASKLWQTLETCLADQGSEPPLDESAH